MECEQLMIFILAVLISGWVLFPIAFRIVDWKIDTMFKKNTNKNAI